MFVTNFSLIYIKKVMVIVVILFGLMTTYACIVKV
jgi:hypothetical protein